MMVERCDNLVGSLFPLNMYATYSHITVATKMKSEFAIILLFSENESLIKLFVAMRAFFTLQLGTYWFNDRGFQRRL